MAHWFDDRVVAAGYAANRPPIHWPIADRARCLLPEAYRPRVGIDVGCGAGGSTGPLVEIADVAIGVDPSEAMLAAARASGLVAIFCSGSAESLPLRDGSVDLVTAAGSLDFVDLRAALREITRVLAPNGNVVVYDYGPARRSRSSDDLNRWYSTFVDRYPPAIDSRQPVTRDALASHCDELALCTFDYFDLDLVLTPVGYTDYLMTQTNVASAVRHGASYGAIRRWCLETLALFFRSPRPVVFDGYIAHLARRP